MKFEQNKSFFNNFLENIIVTSFWEILSNLSNKFDPKNIADLFSSSANITTTSNKSKLTSNELIKYAHDATGIIAGTELYTKEVLDELPNLKVISRLGVGMDNIDQDAAKQKGIKIYKTQTTPALAVAELVLGFMLDLVRKISHQNNILKLKVSKIADFGL